MAITADDGRTGALWQYPHILSVKTSLFEVALRVLSPLEKGGTTGKGFPLGLCCKGNLCEKEKAKTR